jgi:hypothetical protein
VACRCNLARTKDRTGPFGATALRLVLAASGEYKTIFEMKEECEGQSVIYSRRMAQF